MILVTGATGLVGSQLLLDLALKGEKIRALKRVNSDLNQVIKLFSPHAGLLETIEWADGDVLDIFSLQEALKGISKVYHCAAFVSFAPSEVEMMMKININGTANVVNLCLESGVKKLCHVSSVAAINRINEEEIIDENTPWNTSKQNSNYAISKYGAEREVWRGIAEGINVVIVNPTIIIGAGNWKTGSTVMFQQVWKGLKFYTDGTSGFVDVRDVTKAMITLMESNVHAERFILNSENLPFRQVFDWIAENFGKPKPNIYANAFMRGVAWRSEAFKKYFSKTNSFITHETSLSAGKKVRFSNDKIKKAMGIDFIPVRQSVKETCNRFLEEMNSIR